MGQFDGKQLEGYRVIEQIGAGGFGTVFRAYQTDIGREVALKIIRLEFASRPEFIRRFEGEAQMIARLEHPFIVPLYDYWRDPEGAYLAMRWLRGGSIRDALGKGPLALTEAADVLDQVAAALSVAHRGRVVHRDVKPSNILLDEDRNAYISDFGIAKNLALPDEPLTSPGAIVGTPDYLSPEQARGEPVTPQTDIYSMGVMLYEMVTGKHPFHELSSVERLYSHINDPLPEISGVASGAEGVLNAVIQKATAKNPARRYDDVLALATAFRRAVTDHERSGALIAEQLTPRELDILELLGDGLSNQEIADRLVISLATVKWYNQQIYGKLGVSNRVQAASRARQLDLIVWQDSDDIAMSDTGTAISDLAEPENPYKGLNAFQTADKDDFFGRETVVAGLLHKMEQKGEPRFLALVGPSGSGKTSLVRAGLLPAIHEGRLPGSDTWFTVEMVPGTHPLDTLEVVLIKVAAGQTGNLHEQLRRDRRGLVRASDLILPGDEGHLLLVIDQFEELFTLVDDEEERQHLLQLIYTAVTEERSRVTVVIALRADFYDRPLRYPDFGELLRSRMETILPLGPKDLERAITAPARRVQVTFEPGLVAQIVSEMTYQAGALPLLQVALRELFERREGRVLTHAAYEEIGGAVGALANRAERVYKNLDPLGRELARQLLLRLATLGEDVAGRVSPSDAGRRVPRDELLAIADDADLMDETIDLFTRHRLLALDRDPGNRRPTVELAHEALLREWTRLRDWLDEARGEIRLQRQLSRLAAEWQQGNREESFLLRGSRLEQFAGWAGNTTLRLTADEQRYVDASLADRRRRQEAAEEQRRQELEAARQLAETERKRAQEQEEAARRLRRRAIFLVGALALAVLLALATALFAREAARQRANAQEQLSLTRSRELALAALTNLEEDAELSILLALAALSETHTMEAEQVLHRAILADRLLMRLENEAVSASKAAYSADGARLATVGAREDSREAVTVWDATTGEEQFTLRAPYSLYEFAFAPDGAMLATGPVVAEPGPVPPVQLWEASSGRELAALDLAGDASQPLCPGAGFDVTPGFYSLDIGPNASRLATAHCLDGRGGVAIWDMKSGDRLLEVPELQTGWESRPAVVFGPDGTLLASNMAGATVTVWDASSGETVHRLEHEAPVSDVSFSPEGMLLATASVDGQARIWEASSGERLLAIDSGSPEVWGVAFSPDGSQLATAAPDGKTRLWDVETGRELLVLTGAEERFNWVSFHPDGDRLATSDPSGATLVWDLGPTGEFFAAGGEANFEKVSYLADGERIVASDVAGGITFWEAEGDRELLSWQAHEAGVVDMAVGADGATVASGGEDGMVKLWDAGSGELLWSADEERPVWGMDISPDGARLALGSLFASSMNIRDLHSGHLVDTISLDQTISTMRFDPQGERLAVGLLGASPEVAHILDAASGEALLVLEDEGFFDGTNTVAFTPGGARLAAASFGGLVTVFDSSDGRSLLSFKAHDAPIWGLAFTPDGSRLATASVDATVKVWDAGSGQMLLSLEDFGGAVAGLAFDPNGERLVAASYDQSVRGFLLELDDLTALARSRLTRSLTDEECGQYLHRERCPDFSR